MESEIVVTKLRLSSRATFNLTYLGAKNNKPIVDVSTLQYHNAKFKDDLYTTAYIIDVKDINTLKIPDMNEIDTNLVGSEVIIFRGIEPRAARKIATYVAIDLPDRRKYMKKDIRYIALKTYCAFVSCKRAGITKIVTTNLGGDTGATDFIQLTSAWLAGIAEINFRNGKISREIEAFHYPDVWYPVDYIGERSLYKDAYPEEIPLNWNQDGVIYKNDLIKFDNGKGWVYGLVTQDVYPGGTIVFFNLKTTRTRLWRSDIRDEGEKYIAVTPDTSNVSQSKGVLRPSRSGDYIYNRMEVLVYVAPPWDVSVEDDIATI